MDSGDEAFNNFIEIDNSDGEIGEEIEECCESGDSDKENDKFPPASKSKPSKPITEAQLDKIIVFLREHDADLVEKSTSILLWNKLTDDLNSLGPPKHSTAKWKQIWSNYKYRNKGRLSVLFHATGQEKSTQSKPNNRFDQTSDDAVHDAYNTHSEIMKRLDAINGSLEKLITLTERVCQLLESVFDRK